jgi:hypothetical protein
MTPRVRMEPSVAARGEHGSVVIHRKAFHGPRAAGGRERSWLKNSFIFCDLVEPFAFALISPQLTISEH